jgi:hypothetical protein
VDWKQSVDQSFPLTQQAFLSLGSFGSQKQDDASTTLCRYIFEEGCIKFRGHDHTDYTMYMLSGLDFFGKVRERVASLGQRAVGDSFALATSVSRDERMIQLPLELRRCIFEDNDIWDNDLCSLSRVCRAFQFEAERLLYDIIIAKSPADVVVWCKRIIACPRAAPHVYQFDFDINAPGFEPTEYTIFRTNFYLTLSRALKLMTRLRVLCLPDLFGGTLSCFHLFQGCTFKLHTLDSAFPFDDYFIEFLAKQDEITNLQDWGEIDRSERTQVVPLDILPNLLILIASTEDACHILVPNRPITHLDMTFTIPLSLWPVIAISLGPLRVLEIKYIDDFPRILSDLPRSFPELEALQGFDVRTTEVLCGC